MMVSGSSKRFFLKASIRFLAEHSGFRYCLNQISRCAFGFSLLPQSDFSLRIRVLATASIRFLAALEMTVKEISPIVEMTKGGIEMTKRRIEMDKEGN